MHIFSLWPLRCFASQLPSLSLGCVFTVESPRVHWPRCRGLETRSCWKETYLRQELSPASQGILGIAAATLTTLGHTSQFFLLS